MINQSTKITLILASLVLSASCNYCDKKPFCLKPEWCTPTMTTPDIQVDLTKYAGTWYEIARMPAPFQTECICSQAVYGLTKDHVSVDNSCLTKTGETQEVMGKAFSKNDNNTQLKVFFSPLFGGNYWILDLGDNYDYVMVGEPCKSFLWIMARTKTISSELKTQLIGKAKDIGYDVTKLVQRDSSC